MQPGAAQEARGLRSDATPTARSNAGAAMRFDIPSKTLQDALDDFDAATGFSGLYGADAVAFQQSVAVHGRFTPEAALRQLLEQSGLRSYFTARDAYVLEADAGIVVAASPPAPQAGSDFEALLQSGVRAAFCRNALIAPGDYRIALSFRVAATGRVERARLLDTTGDRARDVEVLRSLRSIRFARGPAHPEQAFIMLILPREQSSVADCAAAP